MKNINTSINSTDLAALNKAKSMGLKTYKSVTKCKKDHLMPRRYTNNNTCVKCSAVDSKERYFNNKLKDFNLNNGFNERINNIFKRDNKND